MKHRPSEVARQMFGIPEHRFPLAMKPQVPRVTQ